MQLRKLAPAALPRPTHRLECRKCLASTSATLTASLSTSVLDITLFCSVLAIVLAKALHWQLCCIVSWAVERVHKVLGLQIAQCVTTCLDFHKTTCVLSFASAILAASVSSFTFNIVSGSVWTNAWDSTLLSVPPSVRASSSARVLAGVLTSASAFLVF